MQRGEVYYRGNFVDDRTYIDIWHHRMHSVMSIHALVVSIFIDFFRDHLDTVFPFSFDDIKIISFICAFMSYFHPTIDCLWLGFIPSI